MLIIGERINSTRKSIAEAMERRDSGFIQNEAILQDEAGADYIDVNTGAFADHEEDRLKWLMDTVQKATPKPLCLDSANPGIIKAVIPYAEKPPMINSVSLEPRSLEIILPLVKQYQAKIIGLCQAEGKLAQTAEDKIRIAGKLAEEMTAAGIPLSDLYIDPLVFPLANDIHSAKATFTAITKIMEMLPGVHTTCGLTNVSFGLPGRKLINRTFLITAMASGLDAAILDPTDNLLFSSLEAALMVLGKDRFCMNYLAAFKKGRVV
ncbi:MAG: dihydropteroate synthase [Proteobacteria bacterium]|nr:dihydropteroate synthase [Pseudomonadota bacterium]MBU4470134.1 dihydropteroate synthase [Pseudomonadota bacterium]MCG2753117.1 dihydropteroate synthase [Desulfobacteraceae bacterium]